MPRILAALGFAFLSFAAPAQPVLEVRSDDGRLIHAYWKPAEGAERWIVSLHGTGGNARREIEVWQKSLAGRRIGVVALQWWLGGENYLTPRDLYREIDQTLRKLSIEPGQALLHGFSRGSANLYAVAAMDRGQGGRRLFPLYVASSGGVALDFPPTRAILEGRLGPRPLEGSRWVTACGGRDPNAERDGCPGMRRTAEWLRQQGAQVVLAIEDPNGPHGALQADPRNAARLLDLPPR